MARHSLARRARRQRRIVRLLAAHHRLALQIAGDSPLAQALDILPDDPWSYGQHLFRPGLPLSVYESDPLESGLASLPLLSVQREAAHAATDADQATNMRLRSEPAQQAPPRPGVALKSEELDDDGALRAPSPAPVAEAGQDDRAAIWITGVTPQPASQPAEILRAAPPPAPQLAPDSGMPDAEPPQQSRWPVEERAAPRPQQSAAQTQTAAQNNRVPDSPALAALLGTMPPQRDTDVQAIADQASSVSAAALPLQSLPAAQQVDRSPQAWAARLAKMTDQATPGGTRSIAVRTAAQPTSADSPAEHRASATPVSESTRRFLRPLVGLDPASMRVHRGAYADAAASAHTADAITVGDDIALAAGHADDTPETLGLIAHELVHVARRREPRFVPPIARSVGGSLAVASLVPDSADEERLAQRVEAQVTYAARARASPTVPSERFKPPALTSSGPVIDYAPRADDERREAWGGLPAPWEPLPEWVAASPAPAVDAVQQGAAVEGSVGAPATPVVQRAARGRSLEVEPAAAPTAVPTPEPGYDKAPPADLDLLARQVYAILRRRLAAEQRRTG
jgi:hypothetical protein